jgi:hypothetical protein
MDTKNGHLIEDPGGVSVARRTGGLEEMVLSLTAKGLTSGEIVAHLAEVYGMETSKETVSTITDKRTTPPGESHRPATPPHLSARPLIGQAGAPRYRRRLHQEAGWALGQSATDPALRPSTCPNRPRADPPILETVGRRRCQRTSENAYDE